MPRVTRNMRIRQDPEKLAEYMAEVEKAKVRLDALRRGAQQQMARDIPTSASLIGQVLSGKRVSVDMLEPITDWLDKHEHEWARGSTPEPVE